MSKQQAQISDDDIAIKRAELNSLYRQFQNYKEQRPKTDFFTVKAIHSLKAHDFMANAEKILNEPGDFKELDYSIYLDSAKHHLENLGVDFETVDIEEPAVVKSEE